MPTAFTLIFSALSFCTVAFGAWVMSHPEIVGRGQDPAGKAMAAGFTGCAFFVLTALFAVASAIIACSRWNSLGWLPRIAGPAPVALIILAAIVAIVASSIVRARSESAAFAAKISVPGALIVDVDDSREGALYDAIKPSFPDLEISMRQPGALYWQQSEWFPRVRLLIMSADALAETTGDRGQFARDLMGSLCRAKPTCPIILHAADPAAAADISGRLAKAGWSVHAVMIDTPDWITSRWLNQAIALLKERLAADPAPVKPEIAGEVSVSR